MPELAHLSQLSFHSELHCIDAAVDGQGIILISDLLVKQELANGTLTKALDMALPGYGFYLVYDPGTPKQRLIEVFSEWVKSMR